MYLPCINLFNLPSRTKVCRDCDYPHLTEEAEAQGGWVTCLQLVTQLVSSGAGFASRVSGSGAYAPDRMSEVWLRPERLAFSFWRNHSCFQKLGKV